MLVNDRIISAALPGSALNRLEKIRCCAKPISDQKIGIADIRRAWGELDEAELAAVKSRADLVMQVQAHYGLDKSQAQTRVDLWAVGREF